MPKKITEQQLDTSKYRLKVVYLHDGNSSRRQRHGRQYVTIATVSSRGTGQVLARGVAQCSKLDNPRRAVGRQVAVGRAVAQLQAIEAYEMQLDYAREVTRLIPHENQEPLALESN